MRNTLNYFIFIYTICVQRLKRVEGSMYECVCVMKLTENYETSESIQNDDDAR